MAEKLQNFPLFPKKKTRRSLYGADTDAVTKQKVLVIAHNHPGFFPGGGEVLAYQLFNLLKERPEYEAVFLAATGRVSREAHPGAAFLSYNGRPDEFLFYGDNFDYFLQSQRQAEYLYRDFSQFLREQKPDIVHFHHTLRIGMEALRIIRDILPNARIVYTLHDFIPLCHRDGQMLRTKDDSLCAEATPTRCHECFPDISSGRFKMREQFIQSHLALVDAFAAPSKMLAERFVSWGIPREKIHLVANGTPNVPIAPPRSIKRDGIRNRFGFFGQISRYKGTLLLVEAARILLDRGITDFSVEIHGNIALQPQEYQDRFHEAVAACDGVVNHCGCYENKELPGLIAGMDWVVMPSIWWENSPLVINEALHHGRPVICSHIGGMAEKIQDGVNGLHFRTGNAQALANVMQRAIEESGLWDNLKARITPPPTLEQCLDSYLALFQRPEPLLISKII